MLSTRKQRFVVAALAMLAACQDVNAPDRVATGAKAGRASAAASTVKITFETAEHLPSGVYTEGGLTFAGGELVDVDDDGDLELRGDQITISAPVGHAITSFSADGAAAKNVWWVDVLAATGSTLASEHFGNPGPIGVESFGAAAKLRFVSLGGSMVIDNLELTIESACTVTTLSDAGPGSLRERLANPGCATIVFDETLEGSITLASGQLHITHDLTIQGPGAERLTVNGNDASRVFSVAPDLTVTLEGLTIRGGKASGEVSESFGGGLRVSARKAGGGGTTVRKVNFVGNHATLGGGAIANLGSLTVEASTFTGNSAKDGGALIHLGTSAAIRDSRFEENLATGVGGAVYTAVPLTIDRSTLAHNDATNNGGGALAVHSSQPGVNARTIVSNSTLSENHAASNGGAVRTQGATPVLELINTTISGNTAGGGGAIIAAGEVLLRHVTATANVSPQGAAFLMFGVTTIESSILAGNVAANDIDCRDAPESSTAGYSVIGTTTCPFSGAVGNVSADPKLGSLAENGGPTKTHKLRIGSAAIDLVPLDKCADETDQRGQPRPVGSGCDAGAVEMIPLPVVVANAATISVAEGGTAANIGTFAGAPGVTLAASTGTVSMGSGTWSWSQPATNGPASYDVTITASDNSGDQASVTFSVSVMNVAPVVRFAGRPKDKTTDLPSGGSFTDPGDDVWTMTIDYGDGTPVSKFTPSSDKKFALSHAYKWGKYTLEVCVYDGTDTGCATQTVIVPDLTIPEITFSGRTAYTVDEQVDVTCTADDPESGITDKICPQASGPAYGFVIGENELKASATNGAGLKASATFTFTVSITTASLVTLTRRWVTEQGVANALTQKLQHGQIGAYINQLQAQAGKKITAEHAAILIRLAQKL